MRLYTRIDNKWQYIDYSYKSYINKIEAVSKLFVNYESNTYYSARVNEDTILENVNLIFKPQIDAYIGSSFRVSFTNGGWVKQNNIILCKDSYKVGSIVSYGTLVNTIIMTPTFQFFHTIDESIISKGSNITFHEESCNNGNPSIKVNGSNIKVKIDQGITPDGWIFNDYNTNTVEITGII